MNESGAKPKSAGRKTGAIMAAIIVHLVLGLIFTLIAVLPALRDEPEIVAAVIGPPAAPAEPEVQKKAVSMQSNMAAASAASAMQDLVRANASAVFTATDVPQSTLAMGVGEGTVGAGFGVGSSGGGGMGTGSTMFGGKTANGFPGKLYDMKQTPDKKPRSWKDGEFYDWIFDAGSKGFRESVFTDFFQAKVQLSFTNLAIPDMSADEGPKAFEASKEIEPKMWVVHYTGRVSPPKTGKWRFAGAFDDALVVWVDGKLVFDGSWSSQVPGGAGDARQNLGGPKFLGPHAIYCGKWVEIRAGSRLDIVIGERPGGRVGGALMVQHQDSTYELRGDGSPIIPLFSTAELSAGDMRRVRDLGTEVAKETPIFTVIP